VARLSASFWSFPCGHGGMAQAGKAASEVVRASRGPARVTSSAAQAAARHTSAVTPRIRGDGPACIRLAKRHGGFHFVKKRCFAEPPHLRAVQ